MTDIEYFLISLVAQRVIKPNQIKIYALASL